MNKSDVKSGSVDASNVSSKEDLRDISIQQKLIREYLKDYEISEEVMNNILAMNTRFNASIEENEDVYRNVNWSVKSLEGITSSTTERTIRLILTSLMAL